MPKLRVFRSSSSDIFLNLALEDRLFRTFPMDERVLFLWTNERAVVIGRYQNPWLECRAEEIERDGVTLARRQSGGGTVWHDRGNLCFTFMGGAAGFDRNANIGLVVEALRVLGLEAEANERLDILVAGRKVSGSAFRESSGRSFHHGTLLVSADLAALGRYLASGGTAHRAKGVASVRSPVTNLTDAAPLLTIETVEAALASTAFAAWGAACGREEIEELDLETFAAEPEVAAYRSRLASREWRYGSSPPFARRLTAGGASLLLEIEAGLVRETRLESVEGSPAPTEETMDLAGRISAALEGTEYSERVIAETLRKLAARAVGENTAMETLTAFAEALEGGLFS